MDRAAATGDVLFDQALANLMIDDIELRRDTTAARGNAYLEQEDFGHAATAFRTVVQSSEEDAYALCRLGSSLYGVGDLDKAEEAFRKAIATGEDDRAAAWQGLGQLFRAQGDSERADSAVRQVIELGIERWLPIAWAALGDLATDRGDADQTVAAYRNAVSTAHPGRRAPYAATLAPLLRTKGDLDGDGVV